MRIGSTEAERTHAGILLRRVRQKLRLVADINIQRVKVDMRVGLIKMQGWRKEPVVEREYRLEQAGQTRSWLQVTNIRFDGTDRQRTGTLLPNAAADCRRLDRIPHRRAGAMRLDEGETIGSIPLRA